MSDYSFNLNWAVGQMIFHHNKGTYTQGLSVSRKFYTCVCHYYFSQPLSAFFVFFFSVLNQEKDYLLLWYNRFIMSGGRLTFLCEARLTSCCVDFLFRIRKPHLMCHLRFQNIYGLCDSFPKGTTNTNL